MLACQKRQLSSGETRDSEAFLPRVVNTVKLQWLYISSSAQGVYYNQQVAHVTFKRQDRSSQVRRKWIGTQSAVQKGHLGAASIQKEKNLIRRQMTAIRVAKEGYYKLGRHDRCAQSTILLLFVHLSFLCMGLRPWRSDLDSASPVKCDTPSTPE